MRGTVVRKIPGGKLLRVSVECDGDVIRRVAINGDFFAHPEEAVESLEKALAGARLPDVRRIVERELAAVKLYGVDGNSLVKAVWEAAG